MDDLCKSLYKFRKLNLSEMELKLLISKLGVSSEDILKVNKIILNMVQTVDSYKTTTDERTALIPTQESRKVTFLKVIQRAITKSNEEHFEMEIPSITISFWNTSLAKIEALKTRIINLIGISEDLETLQTICNFEAGLAFFQLKEKSSSTEFESFLREINRTMRTIEGFIKFYFILHQYPILLYARVSMTNLLEECKSINKYKSQLTEEVTLKSSDVIKVIKPLNLLRCPTNRVPDIEDQLSNHIAERFQVTKRSEVTKKI